MKATTMRKQAEETTPHQYMDDALAVVFVLAALYGYYFLHRDAPEWLIAILALIGAWAFGRKTLATIKAVGKAVSR